MRLWLSRNCAASLRDQLTTQLLLGILSEDLKPGEKLPSVRELARRCQIHSNTASAAYRDLEARGWVTLKKGSGVYVRDLPGIPDKEPALDSLIESFIGNTRAQGFPMNEVRARLDRWLDAAPVCRIVVVEPEPELCEILVAELRGRVDAPVTGAVLNTDITPNLLSGAIAVALVSRVLPLRAALPAGTPRLLLRLRSIPESLQGQQRPDPEALIAVASSSSEILRQTRTILAATGLDPDALEFRDVREDGWSNGLHSFQFVIADIVTAPKIPVTCTTRVIRVISDSSIKELQRFLQLVTEPKVS